MAIDLSKAVCRLASLDEIVPLRHEVLRPGLPRESAIFVGDHDATTKHFGVFIDGQNVCCASLMKSVWEGKDAWQLRGMATATALAGCGLGSLLLRAVDSFVLENPPPLMWCNARLIAVGFYKKQGWNVRSEEFMIEGVGPHRKMKRDLRRQKTGGAV